MVCLNASVESDYLLQGSNHKTNPKPIKKLIDPVYATVDLVETRQ